MHIHLRYTQKKRHRVANAAGNALCRLRRITHSLKVSDVQTSVKDFRGYCTFVPPPFFIDDSSLRNAA